jgi:3-methyladenine DNA glycosylase AlkC
MELQSLRDRKPARKMAEIPKEVLESLSYGSIPTKNLTEWLAVDRQRLFEVVVKQLGLGGKKVAEQLWTDELMNQSALKKSFAIGRWLHEQIKVGDKFWKEVSIHESDVVREWAAIVVGMSSELTFARKLAWIKSFADDENAGLREIAWMALRPDVAREPIDSIRCLAPWTGSRAERLRRFASEITRPRGVWTSHIALLKEKPELGLSILEPLKSDDSKSVKDSVGNWLNDASKSKPDWVRDVVQRWLKKTDSSHTEYIAKRALRTLNSQN